MCTKHMAKDCQVFFHRGHFTYPVKSQRYTTESVRPLDGINKDVSEAKLQITTTSVYPVDCVPYWRHSTTVCVLMEAVTHLRLPTHPLTHATYDITIAMKNLLKSSNVTYVANSDSYVLAK